MKGYVPLAAALEGLERWKGSRDWLKDGGQFIPHPATFLNQRRWEDNPTAEINNNDNWKPW